MIFFFQAFKAIIYVVLIKHSCEKPTDTHNAI